MAKLNLYENWPEISAFALLILGFFLATTMGSAVLSYITIILCGAVAGRILFKLKHSLKVPWLLITTGFLIGFVLGSFYGSRLIIAFFYILGIFASYFLHEEGFFRGM